MTDIVITLRKPKKNSFALEDVVYFQQNETGKVVAVRCNFYSPDGYTNHVLFFDKYGEEYFPEHAWPDEDYITITIGGEWNGRWTNPFVKCFDATTSVTWEGPVTFEEKRPSDRK